MRAAGPCQGLARGGTTRRERGELLPSFLCFVQFSRCGTRVCFDPCLQRVASHQKIREFNGDLGESILRDCVARESLLRHAVQRAA